VKAVSSEQSTLAAHHINVETNGDQSMQMTPYMVEYLSP